MLWSGASTLPLLGLLCAAQAIRLLQNGPMIDPEGREYKTVRVDHEDLGRRSPVNLRCTSSSMIILVNSDLNKNGRLMQAGELFLGEDGGPVDSGCRAVPAGAAQLLIEVRLQDCGSTLTISDDLVIYSNKLTFSPTPSSHGITRLPRFTLPVSCYYKRTHFVSSSTVEEQIPPPPPLLSDIRPFSLRLMSDDWTEELQSRDFHLGDLLYLEASYAGAGHKRLFIDSCVATLTPDPASEPGYHFVDNHGCLTDAKHPGSRARFWSRVGSESLRLQMDVVLFNQNPRNRIFITCQLKATELSQSSEVDKACNFQLSRWQNVDRNNQVCRCCEALCGNAAPRWSAADDNTVHGTVTVGPLTILLSQ
ncbi:zona pellucida sperm-binding protein 3-like [Synchiropus picturatus]